MHQIIKFEPTIENMRLYAVSILESEFGISNSLKDTLFSRCGIDFGSTQTASGHNQKEVSGKNIPTSLLDKVSEVSDMDLLLVLETNSVLPNIFYRIVGQNEEPVVNDFFTSIKMTVGSYVILERFNTQIFDLYDLTDESKPLLPVYSCAHDLQVGDEGYFMARSSYAKMEFELWKNRSRKDMMDGRVEETQSFIGAVGPFQSDLFTLQGPILGFSEGKSWMANGFVNAKGNVRVFDVSGKEVYRTSSFNAPTEVDLSDMPSGVYTIQIHNQTGTLNSKLIKE